MSLVSAVPPTIWLRLLMLFYRGKWCIRPLARSIGYNLSMTWPEVIFATKLLLPQIAAYDPDVVIGLGIGGAVWGGVLAASLHDKPLFVIDRKVFRDQQQRRVELVGIATISGNADLLANKRILVVNGEIVSAQTTLAVLEQLSCVNPREVKVACLDYHPNAQRHPDFWYHRNSGPAIQKPWRAVPTYVPPDEPARP